MEQMLQDISTGKAAIEPFTIRFEGIHGLWGGQLIVVHGDGRLEWREVTPRYEGGNTTTEGTGKLDKTQVVALVEAARQAKIWQPIIQKEPALPDTVFITVRITYNEQEASVTVQENKLNEHRELSELMLLLTNLAIEQANK